MKPVSKFGIFGIFLFLCFLPIEVSGAETFSVPNLAEPVTDLAGLVNSEVKIDLNASLKKLVRLGGSQIAILTLPSIGNLTIEQASIKTTDQWKLGEEKRDDGVLILVVKDIRRMRIEVGQGLEGDLPDAIAKRIVDEIMMPLFKSGNYSQGILAGTYEVAKRANPDLNIESIFSKSGSSQQYGNGRSVGKNRKPSIFETIFFAIILLLLISTRTGRALLFFLLVTGMRGGHGGGRSGGYGGRGGGFSGGGASGGW